MNIRTATAQAILNGVTVADKHGDAFTFNNDLNLDYRDVITRLMNRDNEPDLANEAVAMVDDAITDLVDRVLE